VDAAKLLKPILGELVFVGGCTTALLITDKAAADVRPTYDVDAIAEITSYVEYAGFSEKLKALGFREDTREGAPVCRWYQETTTLDVMPLDGSILGFKNTWYEPAMATAEERELEAGLKILMVNPVYFCASKLEAFGDRGKNDYFGSRDLEDVIAVGRLRVAANSGRASSRSPMAARRRSMDRSRGLASRLFAAESIGNSALWRAGCSAAEGGISINLLTPPALPNHPTDR